jgi:hypothetical protein
MLAILVPAALLAGTATAQADPARKVTLGKNALTAKWDGTGSGILGTQTAMDRAGCQPAIHDCDDTLIKLDAPGFVTVHTSSTDQKAVDTDLQLFYSDADGTIGDQIAESAASDPTPDETVASDLDPGYYVARIDYAISAQGTVHADATYEPPAPAAGSSSSKSTTKKRAKLRAKRRR